MDTTTQDSGADLAQPQDGAVAEDQLEGNEQVITTDANGQPTMVPASQASQGASEAVSEETAEESVEETETETETQAVELDDDIVAWTEKKGLKINPDNPNELKLAQMQRDAERAMHQANQTKVKPPEVIEPSGDPNFDVLAERQNQQELKIYVRDWFDANPEMKQFRGDLQKIATERPYLQDMDDIRAHFLADPSRLESLRKQGGKEALQNIAQKQQQTPPSAGATNANAFAASGKITSQNVDKLVANMSPEEYERRMPEINAALNG